MNGLLIKNANNTTVLHSEMKGYHLLSNTLHSTGDSSGSVPNATVNVLSKYPPLVFYECLSTNGYCFQPPTIKKNSGDSWTITGKPGNYRLVKDNWVGNEVGPSKPYNTLYRILIFGSMPQTPSGFGLRFASTSGNTEDDFVLANQPLVIRQHIGLDMNAQSDKDKASGYQVGNPYPANHGKRVTVDSRIVSPAFAIGTSADFGGRWFFGYDGQQTLRNSSGQFIFNLPIEVGMNYGKLTTFQGNFSLGEFPGDDPYDRYIRCAVIDARMYK